MVELGDQIVEPLAGISPRLIRFEDLPFKGANSRVALFEARAQIRDLSLQRLMSLEQSADQAVEPVEVLELAGSGLRRVRLAIRKLTRFRDRYTPNERRD